MTMNRNENQILKGGKELHKTYCGILRLSGSYSIVRAFRATGYVILTMIISASSTIIDICIQGIEDSCTKIYSQVVKISNVKRISVKDKQEMIANKIILTGSGLILIQSP